MKHDVAKEVQLNGISCVVLVEPKNFFSLCVDELGLYSGVVELNHPVNNLVKLQTCKGVTKNRLIVI